MSPDHRGGLVDARRGGCFARVARYRPWHLVRDGKSLCGLNKPSWPYEEQGRKDEVLICEQCVFALRSDGGRS